MEDTTRATHYWIQGGRRDDRAAAAAALGLPRPLLPVVDAHRRLRGPYTGAGTIARALTPDVLPGDPGLVQRYDIELLSAAPELSAIVPNSRETLTSMAIPSERTRFYARLRTRRIANGLVEFVLGALGDGEPRSVIVENADQADRTDLEFLAAAMRRIDPARLTFVVCSAGPDLAEETLLPVLAGRAQRIEAGAATPDGGGARPDLAVRDTDRLARDYVWSDWTSDDPDLLGAYETRAPDERAELHEERAAELAARDEPSLLLGAVPYHLALGRDPGGAGARALRYALDQCVCSGFYWAAAELGWRGLDVVDPGADHELWWKICVELGLALSVLPRTHEAMLVYEQARLVSTDPAVHMAAAYSTAMLYTRHNDPAERDEKKAKRWLNSAIATASLIADPKDRAFQSAFYRNGLALVEVNLGEPSEALRLVNESIDILTDELTPKEHRLHRSVLKNNRARVLLSLGRRDDALADYAVVIRDDPNHAEHYLERGNILRRMGRSEEAFADYATAMRLSPPFPEIYYNRGDLRLAEGDVAGALEDFSYALELEPTFAEAYVSRATIFLDDGDIDAAERDARAGLEQDAGNAYLHAVLGQVLAARGDLPAALAAYDRATAADPSLGEAWACRAAALFESGDVDAAIASLDRALSFGEDAALLFNRATALEAAGRWTEALADLERARQLDPDDADIALEIERCTKQSAPTG